MRLICPNCDAQYEVDPAMIPASGRDVQCSNCGKTWFQEPLSAGPVQARPAMVTPSPEPEPELEPELVDESETEEPEVSERTQERSGDGLGDEAAAFFGRSPAPQAEPVSDDETSLQQEDKTDASVTPEEAPEPEPVPEAADQGEDATEDAASEDEDAADAPSEEEDDEATEAPIRERPPIDPAVLGILRAEAEREIAARRAEEAAGIETQVDLGLDDPEPQRDARSETAVRTARLRGLDEDGDARESRNAILPDIEDINASLTATSDRGLPDTPAEVAEQVEKRRSGFRTGFSAVLIAVAAVILVYLLAPQIASTVPALEPALSAFVDWANGMRLAIDGALDSTATSLNGG